MKKLIITALIVSCMSLAGFSQGISVGLRAGLNLATVGYSGSSGVYGSPNFKAGGFGGAYLTAMLGGKFGLQPEVLFSMQGASSGTIKQSLNYVNIPVFVRVNVAKIINIHAGPQFGILMSAKEKSGGTTTDVKDRFKSSDIGAVVGVGVELPFKLNAGVRFNFGISDINDATGYAETRTRMLQVFLGYSIIGKK